MSDLETDTEGLSNKNYIDIELLPLAVTTTILKPKLDRHFNPFGAKTSPTTN